MNESEARAMMYPLSIQRNTSRLLRLSSPDLHSFWRRHISHWQHSELNNARFCRERGLNYRQFMYWSPKFTAKVSDDDFATQRSKLLPVMIEQQQHPARLQIMSPTSVTISGITSNSATSPCSIDSTIGTHTRRGRMSVAR